MSLLSHLSEAGRLMMNGSQSVKKKHLNTLTTLWFTPSAEQLNVFTQSESYYITNFHENVTTYTKCISE